MNMRKSSEERKQEIIETALELIGESGASGVTVQMIAERIGVAPPTVVRYFKNRDRILDAVVRYMFGQVIRILDDSRGRADERLQELFFRQLSLVSSNPGFSRILFSDPGYFKHPSMKKTVQEVTARYTARVERIIRSGREDGSFRTDVDATDAAVLISATVQGLLIRWSLHDFSFPLAEQAKPLWRHVYAALARTTPPTFSVLERGKS